MSAGSIGTPVSLSDSSTSIDPANRRGTDRVVTLTQIRRCGNALVGEKLVFDKEADIPCASRLRAAVTCNAVRQRDRLVERGLGIDALERQALRRHNGRPGELSDELVEPADERRIVIDTELFASACPKTEGEALVFSDLDRGGQRGRRTTTIPSRGTRRVRRGGPGACP